MADGSITIDTKIDSSDLDSQLSGVKKDLKKGVGDAAKVAAKALAGVAAGIAGIGALSAKFVNVTGEIRKMANMAGVGAKEFQALEYAGSRFGVSADAMADGLKEMQLRTDEFIETGAGPAAEAIERLGYNIEDLQAGLQDTDAFFIDIITRMEDMDRAAQLRIADEMFGGQAAEQFVGMIDAGGQSIEEMAQQARDMGLVMDNDVLQAGKDLRNAFDDLKRVFTVVGAELAGEFSGTLTNMIKNFGEWATTSDNLKEVLEDTLPLIVKIGAAMIAAFVASNIVQTVQGLVVAFKALKLALLSNPILAAATAVTALGVAIATASKNAKELKQQRLAEDMGDLSAATKDAKGELDDFHETAAAVQRSFKNFQDLTKAGLLDKSVNSQAEDLAETFGITKEQVLDIAAASREITGETRTQIEALQEKIDKARELRTVNASNAFISELDALHAMRRAQETENRLSRERKLTEEKERQAKLDKMARDSLSQVKRLEEMRLAGILDREDALHRMRKIRQDELDLLQEKAVDEDLTEDEIKRVYRLQHLIGIFDGKIQALTASTEELGDSAEEAGKAFEGIDPETGDSGLGGKDIDPKRSFFQNPVEGFIDDVVQGLKEGMPQMLAATIKVGDMMVDAFSWGLEKVRGVFDWMRTFNPSGMVEALKEMTGDITRFFMKDLGSIPIFFDQGVAIISDMVSGLLAKLPVIIETIGNVIDHVVKRMIKDGPKIIKGIVKIIGTVAKAIMKNGAELVTAGISLIFDLIGEIADMAPALIKAAGGMAIALAKGLIDGLPDIIGSLIEIVLAMTMWVARNADILIQMGIDMVVAITIGISENLDKIVVALIEAIPLIIIALLAAIPRLIVAAFEMAGALIQGIIQGLGAGVGKVMLAIADVGRALIDAFKGFFGISSPSTVFAGLGGDLIAGLIKGLLSAGAGLWDAVKGVFTGLMSHIKNIFSGVADFGASVVGGLVDGFESVVSVAGDAVSAAAEAASAAGGGVVDWIGDTIGGIGDTIGGLFGFAKGTDSAPGGLAIVGEEGPELMEVPRGSRIIPAGGTQKLMRGVSSVMAGLSRMRAGTPAPSGGAIMINNRMTGAVQVDGETIGRIAYENLDKVAL